MSSWKDVLQKQKDDLERLEAMDREMAYEHGSTAAEADRVLRRNPNFGVRVSHSHKDKVRASVALDTSAPVLDLSLGELDLNEPAAAASPARGASSASARGTRSSSAGSLQGSASDSGVRRSRDAPNSPGPPTPTPTTADTAARFAK